MCAESETCFATGVCEPGSLEERIRVEQRVGVLAFELVNAGIVCRQERLARADAAPSGDDTILVQVFVEE
jgi:hypothetical protein